MTVKVAITQKPPVLLDLKSSLNKAIEIMNEVADAGAKLVVFPETFLPGYPSWIWRLRPGGDMALGNTLHTKLRNNAVDIANGGLESICEVALKRELVVVIGMNEIDSEFSGSTLFNTVVVIDVNGEIVNRHRKIMPTNPERMVWGFGDGSGLRVVDTAVGRIGCLICWENYMPLARYSLFAQDIDIYIAPTWDSGDNWIASMNHIAREGGCWVLSTATALQGKDIPDSFPERDKLFPAEEWINPGDAVVVKPFGGVVAGPLHKEKSFLYFDIDLGAARDSRKALDVAGHYNRPDIFHFELDRRTQSPIQFIDDPK
ncbi:carbon-nitrogen hydrolase family protein [Moritella sp. F3]|uniref:carbon-nitrogen hydrolase family protein n=1 Tax=Moritella sp. F3 TaxID=2718882 RepID=UPI0018E177AF|nr:carbon-nitrogen hydrolase family protein [Moritella sp. F3]GIC76279.1 nitrilase [Moritella sp. F1]GIC82933.1 nitrilase [Moritella sp. F3]